eukprot:869204-Prorocentrum_minimum.AAC.1
MTEGSDMNARYTINELRGLSTGELKGRLRRQQARVPSTRPCDMRKQHELCVVRIGLPYSPEAHQPAYTFGLSRGAPGGDDSAFFGYPVDERMSRDELIDRLATQNPVIKPVLERRNSTIPREEDWQNVRGGEEPAYAERG